MAMDLCINEKDEERESEAQSVVRAKKRARGGEGWGRAQSVNLTAPVRLAAVRGGLDLPRLPSRGGWRGLVQLDDGLAAG